MNQEPDKAIRHSRLLVGSRVERINSTTATPPPVQPLRIYDQWTIVAMEAKYLLKDKKFWLASFLIAWAAGLQGHMMWMQKQDTFKQKFGDLEVDSPQKD